MGIAMLWVHGQGIYCSVCGFWAGVKRREGIAAASAESLVMLIVIDYLYA